MNFYLETFYFDNTAMQKLLVIFIPIFLILAETSVNYKNYMALHFKAVYQIP
jgi:hypothetical protein